VFFCVDFCRCHILGAEGIKQSLGQRSRSVSNGQRNPVNSVTPEPLKGFKPKPT